MNMRTYVLATFWFFLIGLIAIVLTSTGVEAAIGVITNGLLCLWAANLLWLGVTIK